MGGAHSYLLYTAVLTGPECLANQAAARGRREGCDENCENWKFGTNVGSGKTMEAGGIIVQLPIATLDIIPKNWF